MKTMTDKEFYQMFSEDLSYCNHESEMISVSFGREVVYCVVCFECKAHAGFRANVAMAQKCWDQGVERMNRRMS